MRTADAVLMVSLLALWAVCTALHVKQIAGGRLAWVGIYVADPDGDYPRVRGFWPWAPVEAAGGLALGDRLLQIAGTDLRGVGPFGFVARAHAAAEGGERGIPITYERGGATADTAIALVPIAFPWRMLPVTCTVVASAALVLARRPGKRVARAFFLLAIAYALHWSFFFGGSPAQSYAWVAVFAVASTVMLPLILRAVLIFPEEVAPAGGRLPWWPWLFAIAGPLSLSWIYGVPMPPDVGFRGIFALNIAFIVTVLGVLTRNFRRAGANGRRQLKWVVLGMYVGTMPVLLTDAVGVVVPELWWLHEVAVVAETFVPLFVLIAIVRTNYFDVDRLITWAAVYTVLSILLLAAVLIAVPQMARIASRAGDLDPHAVQWLLSVVVAGGIVPVNRLLRPRMERILFRERHALRAGVEHLLRELAAAAGPGELLTLAGERLDALVRPRACVIYAPVGESFDPVFARTDENRGAPPALGAGALSIEALRARTAPLEVEPWMAARARLPLPEERAALEQLHAAVLLPVRRGADLAAAIWLGAKRSGDIYTPTDLALLAAVADKISGELLRFDTAVILRQERRMNAALRRYVPRPVAARLTRGLSIEGGEREVSVLFVDIRGYTQYSEAQAVDEVFSMVNRYTEAVSAVIQRRGGTVVEFLGDGLMAVFGAPDPLPDRARVAVQAAREVVAAVRELGLGASDDGAPITVGIGIASGRAFVGNIRTSDRFVYTAIGDVVNLASRIQGLTRDLHAAVAIDARTHRRAGESAASFRRHERVRIRGRAEAVDIYSLPDAAA